MRDRLKRSTRLASVNSAGQQADLGADSSPSISEDGRFIGFNSSATNLVAGDTNGSFDGFVHERRAPDGLALGQETAHAAVGAQHCVNAAVAGEDGDPLPGETVRFTVAGADETSGTAATDEKGFAQFCFTVSETPGWDVIRATAGDERSPSDRVTLHVVAP